MSVATVRGSPTVPQAVPQVVLTPQTPQTRVIALTNHKGGVGKTTTALNLAAELAHRGQEVLLVDLDPQANATTALGFDLRLVRESFADTLLHGRPLAQIAAATRVPHLTLIPGSDKLHFFEASDTGVPEAQYQLTNALASLPPAFDVVIVDCPPAFHLPTRNALAAATDIVIPLQPGKFSVDGLGDMRQAVKAVIQARAKRGAPPPTVSVLVTMHQRRSRVEQVFVDQLQTIPERVLATTIPYSETVKSSQYLRRTVREWRPNSPVAKAFAALADELQFPVLEAPQQGGV